jgi:2-polyprenyl-3-methyl-5-hydroxy-6-metoxy-1,4-benzoquinol methylase
MGENGVEKKIFPCAGPTALCQGGQNLVLRHRETFAPAHRCAECGYIFFDSPGDEYLAEFYSREYPESAASWYNYESDYSEKKAGSRAKYLIRTFLKFAGEPARTLHECGCSFGGTVARLNQMSYDATGTEFGSSSVSVGRERGNLNIFNEDEKSFLSRSGRQIDLFYAFHAVEHMPRPDSFLSQIRPYCSDRGLVILHVPNAVNVFSISKGFRSNHWFSFPGHLHFLSPRSSLCLAEKTGYEVIDVSTAALVGNPTRDIEVFGADASEEGSDFREFTQAQLMGQELRIVLAPKGSESAKRNAEKIKKTREECERSGVRENWFLQLVS